ncbi:MAG: hypothetical protein Q8P67_24355, partial [archaeon]|nr:hypothetical protein [archaeon]
HSLPDPFLSPPRPTSPDSKHKRSVPVSFSSETVVDDPSSSVVAAPLYSPRAGRRINIHEPLGRELSTSPSPVISTKRRGSITSALIVDVLPSSPPLPDNNTLNPATTHSPTPANETTSAPAIFSAGMDPPREVPFNSPPHQSSDPKEVPKAKKAAHRLSVRLLRLATPRSRSDKEKERERPASISMLAISTSTLPSKTPSVASAPSVNAVKNPLSKYDKASLSSLELHHRPRSPSSSASLDDAHISHSHDGHSTATSPLHAAGSAAVARAASGESSSAGLPEAHRRDLLSCEDLKAYFAPFLESLQHFDSSRDKIAREILSSEVVYCDQLSRLVIHLKRAHGSPFSADEIKNIFGSIETIHNINVNLLEQLEDRFKSWNDETMLGDIFESFSPYFKLYAAYCDRQSAAASLLRECMKRQSVQDFVARQRPLCNGQLPSALLILPVQRIPRYQMLLADLRMKTPADHRDQPHLAKALESVTQTSEYVEESILKAEKTRNFAEISSKIDGLSSHIAPHRRFSGDGYFRTAGDPGRPSSRLHVLLFNDCIILTEPNSAHDGRERVIHLFPLASLAISDAPSSSDGIQASGVRIEAPEDASFLLLPDGNSEVADWCEELLKAQKAWGERLPKQADQGSYKVRVDFYSFLNGNKYAGTWKASKPCGHGTWQWASGELYQGSVVGELPSGGIGKLTLPAVNGVSRVFKGHWEAGQLLLGKEFCVSKGAKRVVYNGQFRNGLYHGVGFYPLPHGDSYQGEFLAGRIHGQGTLTRVDRRIYSGTWEDGVLHGMASVASPLEGINIEASYEAGVPLAQEPSLHWFFPGPKAKQTAQSRWSGPGIRTRVLSASSPVLPQLPLLEREGNFPIDIFESIYAQAFFPCQQLPRVNSSDADRPLPPSDGFARLAVNGDAWVYEGEFLNDQRHGLGTILVKNSTLTLTCTWEHDQRQGCGTWTWQPNPSTLLRFTGHYRDDLREGKCKLFHNDTCISNCIWKNGKRNGPGKVSFSPTCSYNGEWADGRPSGQGFYQSPNLTFRGTWTEGFAHGKGFLSFVDLAEELEGEFDRGYVNGFATLRLSDGSSKRGEWVNGKPNGPFKLRSPSGILTWVQSDREQPDSVGSSGEGGSSASSSEVLAFPLSFTAVADKLIDFIPPCRICLFNY